MTATRLNLSAPFSTGAATVSLGNLQMPNFPCTWQRAISVFAFLLGVQCGLVALAQPKPNIIFLLSDDAGYADFGFMNQFTGQTTEFKTPNLDALAQQSVRFSQAYVSASVCSASRAGVLTGRYQERFGFDYNVSNANDPRDGMPTNETLIFEALKTAGYSTGVIGKWHIGAELVKQPQNQGVDEFFGIWEGSEPYFTGGARRGATAVNWKIEPSFNNIPADPTLGRMITDAHGDEASKFIATHANQANPFFMYVPFTAPHSPYDQAKASDLAQFDSTSMTGYRKNTAALTYAMDRAVGNIMARVNDPNGDGNTSDSIANNTIIVFTNDNGGDGPGDPVTNGEMVTNNFPLRDYKASLFEGGIRVPMLIKAPGATPGNNNQVVSSLDFFPTFLNAAGVANPGNLDGIDVMPFLTGQQAGVMHDELFWRGGVNGFAVRKGDWKVTKGVKGGFIQLYHLNPDGSGETVIETNNQPAKYQELINDYVDWETAMAKGSSTTMITYLNRFDGFRFRNDLGTSTNWRDAGVWRDDASPATVATMQREDAYANAMLVFEPRNDASYTSNNNISRTSGLDYSKTDIGFVNPAGLAEFMMNRLQLSGQFNSAVDRSGTLAGWPLMLTKSLNGVAPRIALEATSASSSRFTYNVNMDIVLHDSVEIAGNGTQVFIINGQLRDFRNPASVTKTGTSTAILSGNNIYTGSTNVNDGVLRLDGTNAALANTSAVTVGAQGTLALAGGRIHTNLLQIAAGGAFNFTGGVLETLQVTGDLINNGGDFQPGFSTAAVAVSGDFVQNSGKLSIEIGGTTPGTKFDKLVVGDDATLGGVLQVSLVDAGSGLFVPSIGNAFEILTVPDILGGKFSGVVAPALPTGRKWAIQYGAHSVTLSVVAGLAADFNGSGAVDSSDLGIWKSAQGLTSAGDADLDGDSDAADFLVWQRQNGTQLVVAATQNIPEGSSVVLALIALCFGAGALRRHASA